MILRTRNIIEQIRQGEIPKGYIRTVSGISPTDWKRYTFGDIYTERKEPGSEELPLLMVSIHSGVSDGEVDEEELPKKVKRIEDKSQYKKAVSGDLVFNMMRAWQGAIGTVRTTGMVSPAYIVAKPNDKVYPLFMDYYTRTPQMINQINRQSYGVTDFRKRLYWDSFATIGCTLPPIEEQRKIAAILTTQDRVIELKEKRLAEKQRQKKYLMQQLLTGKKRLPGFSGEWKSVIMGEIGATFSGLSSKSKEDFGQGKPYIPYINIYSNSIIDTKKLEYVRISDEERQEKVKYGDIFFTTSSETPDEVGMSSVLLSGVDEVYLNSFCFGFRLYDFSVLLPVFAAQYFRGDAFRSIIKVLAQGATRYNLSKNNLLKCRLSLPSIREQTAIAEILSAADREIDLLRQDIEQEKQKKKALMQLLLTGIVRVNA